VALITSLLWAAQLTPAFASGVVTDCSNDVQFSSLLAGGWALSVGRLKRGLCSIPDCQGRREGVMGAE
jgi:hypothetical protein